MTVSTAPTPLSYAGNGSTTAFPITWKYNSTTHVVATLRSSSGTETVWVVTTNYTITAAGDTGTLTAVVAPATGETLVITLEPPNTQSSDIPVGGDFPSTTVEDGLDLSAQRDAKIEALFLRALRVPKTDTKTGSSLELPIDTARASMFLAFDADGEPIASAGTSANLGPVSAFIDTLLDDADAATARTTLGAVGQTISDTNPQLYFYETDASVDNKQWSITVDSETLYLRAINDAGSSGNGILTVSRTGIVVDTVVIGGTPVELAAGQLKFPATQNASADANTLDDYEEGTWTPSIGGTATYTTQTGTYTKIGRKVFIRGTLTINVIGTGNTYTVSGLPFASAATSAGSVAVWNNIATAAVFVGCNTDAAASTITFRGWGAASTTVGTGTVWGNSASVTFSCTYEV